MFRTHAAVAAALCLAGLSASPRSALAWGDEGHKIAALVAYSHLTPEAKSAVDAMLAEDDDTLTPPDIASRATWADKYRDSDRNTTQVRYQLTQQWHFVDIELDQPDEDAACFSHPASNVPASAGPSQACVVDRIGAFALDVLLHQWAADDALARLLRRAQRAGALRLHVSPRGGARREAHPDQPAGCINVCEHGPVMVVYPEAVW